MTTRVPAQRPATTERGRKSRARLVDSARAELIEREGILEVDSVARRADTSVGLIYRHFGSRSGLISAVIDDYYARFRVNVLPRRGSPRASLAQRERRRIELSVRFLYDDPLTSVLLSHRHLDSEVVDRESAHLRVIIDRIARDLRSALPPDRDSALAAAMILGGMQQVIAACLDTGVPPSTATAQLWVYVAAIVGVDPDS